MRSINALAVLAVLAFTGLTPHMEVPAVTEPTLPQGVSVPQGAHLVGISPDGSTIAYYTDHRDAPAAAVLTADVGTAVLSTRWTFATAPADPAAAAREGLRRIADDAAVSVAAANGAATSAEVLRNLGPSLPATCTVIVNVEQDGTVNYQMTNLHVSPGGPPSGDVFERARGLLVAHVFAELGR